MPFLVSQEQLLSYSSVTLKPAAQVLDHSAITLAVGTHASGILSELMLMPIKIYQEYHSVTLLDKLKRLMKETLHMLDLIPQ